MKLKLTELTEKITPLPWKKTLNGGISGSATVVVLNDVSQCIEHLCRPINNNFGNAESNTAYLVHCANTLPKLVEALERIFSGSDDLFQLATDSIVHSSDGSWSCKSCGMELDSGGGHSDACCASAILDLAVPLHAAEAALTLAREVEI